MILIKFSQKIDKTEITSKGIGTKGTGKGHDREIMREEISTKSKINKTEAMMTEGTNDIFNQQMAYVIIFILIYK
jgi:hypothetical protein